MTQQDARELISRLLNGSPEPSGDPKSRSIRREAAAALESQQAQIARLEEALETIRSLTSDVGSGMSAVALVEAHDEIAYVAREALRAHSTVK